MGSLTKSLTLVGLTFDVINYDANTASGTSDQGDGTTVNVGLGNQSGAGEGVSTTVSGGAWTAAFTMDVTYDMGGDASIPDPDGDETVAGAPPFPTIRASASGNRDRVAGFNFAANTSATLKVNTVPVTDPPTTDGWGNFFYSPPGFDLEVGDVVEVTVGAQTKSLTLVGLTFDVIDYALDTASGTSDQPDETVVNVVIGNQNESELVTTTVTGGTWNVAFTIDVTPDMGGEASISEPDNDQTVAVPAQMPNIRATASSNQDRVTGFNFAPNTVVTLKVNSVAVADPPTTDGSGNFNYMRPSFNLNVGDVVEVTVGAQTKSLTLVGLTFDVLDYAADTASGTSDQPDGTVVNVGVGDQNGFENVTTTVTGGTWNVAFTIDVTTNTGGDAWISEPDNDQTVAFPPFPPSIRASASSNPDQVQGFNFAPNTVVTLKVNLVPVADPPTTDGNGNFSYMRPSFNLNVGDAIEVTVGARTRSLTLVGLTFDVVDYDANTASGTSNQPGATVNVNVGNQNATTTVSSGAWSVAFADIAPPMGGQASISEPDGDQTFANSPPQAQIRASVSNNPDQVSGFNFAPNTPVTLKVNSVAVADPPTTDAGGSFNYMRPTFNLNAGDVIEVTVGAKTRSLTLVGLTFDVVDYEANTASGTSDQADGTPVMVFVGNQAGGANATTTVSSGAWSVAFTTDVTTGMGGMAWISEPDGDQTTASSPAPPPPSLNIVPSAELVDAQAVTLTGAGWPAGKTLYVTQCRLDQPLGYHYL